MSFLTAEWNKLAIANYAVDPSILKKYIPFKTELDLWNNTCYVSLVGFMFQNTKLLGIKIPFHTDFEEVNLRFYVYYKDQGKWKRGVVFIKELVPKLALTFIANTIYNEHYETVPMSHKWIKNKKSLLIEYSWGYQNQLQNIQLETENISSPILKGSEAEFITEHYWGYTKVNDSKTFEYEVKHPRWESYKVLKYNINVDFELVYGKEFSFLNSISPVSVMLAEGSEISVENKSRI